MIMGCPVWRGCGWEWRGWEWGGMVGVLIGGVGVVVADRMVV